MTLPLLKGADSAYPPSLQDIQIATSAGIKWWGFYINGIDGDEDPLNTWPPSAVQRLIQMGIQPVGIWVPDPNLAADPVDAANESFAACVASGYKPEVSILYDGNHLTNTGQINGPVWLPIVGSAPVDVGKGSAIQFGNTVFGATSVDLSLASADWPKKGIVVDFEFNTAKNVSWYQTYQKRITQLGATVTPVPPPVKSGVITEPIIQAGATWQGNNARFDVVMVGKDTGKVYHKWWDIHGWHGPDIITNSI